MKKGNKEIIILGDRVLVRPLANETRTRMGLYLPQTVQEKEEVAMGIVEETGPGIPMADPSSLSDEPWKSQQEPIKYIPMQVDKGDVIFFLRKAAIELTIDGDKFFVVSQAAILVIIREDITPFSDMDDHDPDLLA